MTSIPAPLPMFNVKFSARPGWTTRELHIPASAPAAAAERLRRMHPEAAIHSIVLLNP